MSKKANNTAFSLKLGFQQGLQFELAHNWLQERHEQNLAWGKGPGAAIAIPVVSAFAAELYLKCLHVIDHGAAQTGHQLVKLFSHLNADTQSLVRQLYDADLDRQRVRIEQMSKALGTSFDFDSALSSANNGFVEWRYFFEKDDPLTWNGSLIKFACRRAIVRLKPELTCFLEILRDRKLKQITEYLNGKGEPAQRIGFVRVFGNGTHQVIDGIGQDIPGLHSPVPIEDVVRLADQDTIWMGDNGPIDPPFVCDYAVNLPR